MVGTLAILQVLAVGSAQALEPQPIDPPPAADGELALLVAPNYVDLYEEVDPESLFVTFTVKRGNKRIAKGEDVSLKPGSYTVIQTVEWEEFELRDIPFDHPGFYLTRDDPHDCLVIGPDTSPVVTNNTWANPVECIIPEVISRMKGTLRLKDFEINTFGEINSQFAKENANARYTIQGPPQQVIGPQVVLSDYKTASLKQRIRIRDSNPRCMTETDKSRLRVGMSKQQVTAMMGKGSGEAFSSIAGYSGEIRSYQYCDWADRLLVVFSGGRVSGWAGG